MGRVARNTSIEPGQGQEQGPVSRLHQDVAGRKRQAHVRAQAARRKAVLLGGDTAPLLTSAAMGRSNCGESLDTGSVLTVARLTLWCGCAGGGAAGAHDPGRH